MIYLDDGFFAHPKVIAAGGEATLLYLKALGWLKQQGSTDGRIPTVVLPVLAPDLKGKPVTGRPLTALAARLVDVALWDQEGPAHWVCHGYVERNQKAINKSEQARAAARQRHAKQQAPPKQPQSDRISETDADADAESMRTQNGESCVRNAVPVSQPTAHSPQPTSTAHGVGVSKSRGSSTSVTANGANPGTADAETQPTDGADGWGDPEATGPDESPDDRLRRRDLAIRWRDTLDAHGVNATLVACNRTVAEALHAADARIIDEQIGWLAEATDPPRTPAVLLTAIRRMVR